MEILPERGAYLRQARSQSPFPILGQKKVGRLDPARLFSLLYKDRPHPFLLESGKGPPHTARYSFMGAATGEVLRADAHGFVKESRDGTVRDAPSMRDLLSLTGFNSDGPPLDHVSHFWGGWVGLFGYETARWLEPGNWRRTPDLKIPDVYLMKVNRLLAYDHQTGILKFVVTVWPHENPGPLYAETVREIKRVWRDIEAAVLKCREDRRPSCPDASRRPFSGFQSNLSKVQYMAMVDRAKDYIAAGDVYQVNLAQRFEGEYAEDPFDLYLRLRQVNPSPFSGFLPITGGVLVSSSPERLLQVEGDWIKTRPIAGTRPRGKSPLEDARLSSELILNEKEQAEHLMLVDLERNDLGRLCRYGTVEVTDFMALERYSHVHHIVSEVRGRLRPGLTLMDLIKAVFPGGTITGCPKIRCMEIITELETAPRGPYCGSLGYIGYGPHLDLNIIIRTILVAQGKASFHVGAGIVADSAPHREYEETLAKAGAMMHVLVPEKR